jgi:cell division protein FtsI (penicillin-binding protein 3)
MPASAPPPPDKRRPPRPPAKRPLQALPSRRVTGSARGDRRPPKGQPTLRPKVGAGPQNWSRLIIVWGVLILGMVLLAINLVWLQVFRAEELQQQAKQQQTITNAAYTPRRPILDRLGNVLAIDRPVYTLFAYPWMFNQPPGKIAAELSPIINRPPAELLALFAPTDVGQRVMYDLSEDTAHRVRELRLDGLDLVPTQRRIYPHQDLFADVVGFVNEERKGQAGLEMSQEKLLETPIQQVALKRAGDGSIIPSQLPDNVLKPDELRLRLTLDSRLQRTARNALQQQMQRYKAKRGAAIVMDVKDGSLLSLVSEPTYDPNQYYKTDAEKKRNWAISDLYEPGSTFKPINVAIALEAGAIQPNDVFHDEGQIIIGDDAIQNSDYSSAGARGPVTVTEILQYSSNVGMVHIMRKLQAGDYYHWLEKIGLGQPTGIDIPAETAGQIKDREEFVEKPIETAVTAFGQGFSLTPLQLVQLQSAIANGGQLVTPHVVDGLYDGNGILRQSADIPPAREIFSPKTSEAVLAMMEKVVSDGTGQPSQIPGYRIAGKTGTAQKAGPGGYLAGVRITSFIASFPANEPRYTVLVVVDEPQGDDAYGSTVAAPVVKTIMEALISIGQIPPTEPIDQPLLQEEQT